MRKTKFLALLMSVTMALSVSPVYAYEQTEEMTVEQEITIEKKTVSSTDFKYPVTGGYIYFDESTGTITGSDETVTDVVIPSHINGVAVKSIGTGAFAAYIKSMNLVSITIEADLDKIELMAFYSCTNLTEFKFNGGSIKELGTNIFDGCTSLNVVLFPTGFTTIPYKTFNRCEHLTYVSLPEGIETIGENAFYRCTALQEIELPSTLKYIETRGFNMCTSLISIALPDGFISTEECAFLGCSSLETVVIPKTVEILGYSTFYNCESIKDVYYGGTEYAWDNPSKFLGLYTGDETLLFIWNSDDLLNANVHFEYVAPVLTQLLEVGEFTIGYDREMITVGGQPGTYDNAAAIEFVIKNTSDLTKQIVSAVIIESDWYAEVYFIDETLTNNEEMIKRITCQRFAEGLKDGDYYIVDFNSIDEMYDFRDGFCIKDDSVMTLNYFIPGGMDTLLK